MEMVWVTDPGQHQQLGRADRAGRENDLAGQCPFGSASSPLDPNGTLAVEENAPHLSPRPNLEIGPGEGRPKIRLPCRPPPPPPDVKIKNPEAVRQLGIKAT